MTYATCEDCGSVGRHHYAHCTLGDQPRVETGEQDPLLRTMIEDDIVREPQPAWASAVESEAKEEADLVNHPPHYTQHPSGVECIQIVEHMNFCRGNAVKYIWRAGDKGNEIEDLKKARWYLDREIERLQNSA